MGALAFSMEQLDNILMSEYLCRCKCVTESTVCALASENADVAFVQRVTLAGTECHSCVRALVRLVNDTQYVGLNLQEKEAKIKNVISDTSALLSKEGFEVSYQGFALDGKSIKVEIQSQVETSRFLPEHFLSFITRRLKDNVYSGLEVIT